MRTVFKNASVYLSGAFIPSDLSVENGIVKEISPEILPALGDIVFDFTGSHIFPGLADVHVHLREPGFSYKETISSGTAAAAHGGFTALCAMPNLSPAPDSPEHLKAQTDLIERDALVRVFPYASITVGRRGEGSLVDFEALGQKVIGFSDDGSGIQSEELMREAMLAAKRQAKPIAAHCEDNSLLNGGYIHDGSYAAAHGHRGICSESEWGQIARDLRLAAETGCHYHVCHISAKESVEIIRRAKREGVNVSCETAPHYLALCEDDLQEEGRFKMNPPLRSAEDRAALLEGVADGTIDVIATDHAPHSKEEKSRGLEKSLMGVVGLETSLPVCYTVLVKAGIITLERLIKLMSVTPRELFGIGGGELKLGAKADFTVFDFRHEKKVSPDEFLSLGSSTPFEGRGYFGECLMTVCDGKTVFIKETLQK